MARLPSPRTQKTCEREGCGKPFEVTSGKAQQARRFCSKDCSNKATAQQRATSIREGGHGHQPPTCPCGKPCTPALDAKTKWTYRKYCSPECRAIYGKKRQADPANYVTFNCETCGEENTRYRKYGNGANRFCNNECAAKWTRKVHHIGIKDSDVVLDSSYEAYVWGLCIIHKIPIERVDRTEAVSFKDGWYAPDFIINKRYVEVKGFEDDDDRKRYAAWNEAHPSAKLLVLRKEDLSDELVLVLGSAP